MYFVCMYACVCIYILNQAAELNIYVICDNDSFSLDLSLLIYMNLLIY